MVGRGYETMTSLCIVVIFLILFFCTIRFFVVIIGQSIFFIVFLIIDIGAWKDKN